MSRIDELYAKYFKPLIRSLGRNEDAEDIAQETLIARWKRPEDPQNEWAYLRKSAWNNATKRVSRANAPRRGGGLLTQLEDEHDAIDETLSAEADLIKREEIAQFRTRLDEVMAKLGPETQQCLALRRQGLGSKEIAEHLPGLSDQAVRTRLSRAMRALMKLLGDETDDHQR